MIQRAENMGMLRQYAKQDLFSVRICALAGAYGFTYDFVSFYVQLTDGKVTALVSDLEGDLTISALASADREELAAFAAMRAHRSVLTDTTFCLSENYQTGAVMQRLAAPVSKLARPVVLQTPDLTDLFEFMNYARQNFAAWYTDLNYRIRHGCARTFAIYETGQIVSAAVLAFIDGRSAILTSVRTLPSARGRGLGSSLVRQICQSFDGQIYLMCNNGAIVQFYEKLGFQKTENWRMFL